MLRAQDDPDGTSMASGAEGMTLAGIGSNSDYARGGSGVSPSGYADPLLPWGLSDPDPAIEEREQALNLTFADAHAADRCRDLTQADLEAYVDAARSAAGGGDPLIAEAACGQCVQMVAPHLRFGVEGNHDPAREAFCALAAGPPFQPAFFYTGEDPPSPGPDTLDALRAAARTRCCTGGGSDLAGLWGGTCTVFVDEPGDDLPPEAFDCELNLAVDGADLSGDLEFCGAGTVLFSATQSGEALVSVVIDEGDCVVTGSGTVVGDEITTQTSGPCDEDNVEVTLELTRGENVCP